MLTSNNIKMYCYEKVKDRWLSSKDRFPDFLNVIPSDVKIQNEQAINNISKELSILIKDYPRIPFRRNKWKKKILSKVNEFISNESILNLHKVVDQNALDGLQEELQEFLRHVKKFSPELSFADIGQAIRNYTVYIMFKELNNVSMKFNEAAFGYSMLYPFTDNYIDSAEYSSTTKQEYNEMIKNKIQGKPVKPRTEHQRKTCDLLQAIASRYPRELDSSIYNLLLMMLEAQEDSIRQQNNDISLTPDQRLDISLYKGGVSVFIDRFFVDKEITEDDLFFYLAFGFFLQLADDLQDIGQDSLEGNKTLFTIDLDCKEEEKVVNKMLHFISSIIETYPSENEDFKNFILMNCYYLVYSSVIGSKEFFSDNYIEKIVDLFPVTIEFMENVKANNIEKLDLANQIKYKKIVDTLIK